MRHRRCCRYRCPLRWPYQIHRCTSRKCSRRTVRSSIRMARMGHMRHSPPNCITSKCPRARLASVPLWIPGNHRRYLIRRQCCIRPCWPLPITAAHPISDKFAPPWTPTTVIRTAIRPTSPTMACNNHCHFPMINLSKFTTTIFSSSCIFCSLVIFHHNCPFAQCILPSDCVCIIEQTARAFFFLDANNDSPKCDNFNVNCNKCSIESKYC